MSIQLELWEKPAKAKAQAPATHSDIKATVASKLRAADAIAGRKTKADTLSTLRRQIEKAETARRPNLQAISSGSTDLDALLPEGGYPPGCLIEWIASSESSGAQWLSLVAAAAAHQHSHGKIVVLDADRTFYPPAAVACGLPADAVILLQPQNREDALWALDQALRSPAVAAAWGCLSKLDDSEARRLQLAAETGGTLGMFVRPAKALHTPSWAEVRWQVRAVKSAAQEPAELEAQANTQHSAARMLAVRLLKLRRGAAGKELVLSIDQQSGIIRREPSLDTTSAQRLAAELAHPAVTRRRASHSA